jgi:hypothetical protein
MLVIISPGASPTTKPHGRFGRRVGAHPLVGPPLELSVGAKLRSGFGQKTALHDEGDLVQPDPLSAAYCQDCIRFNGERAPREGQFGSNAMPLPERHLPEMQSGTRPKLRRGFPLADTRASRSPAQRRVTARQRPHQAV